MIQVLIFKRTDDDINSYSVSGYIIATIHSPSWQFAQHDTEIGKIRWKTLCIHVYTHTSSDLNGRSMNI